MQNQALVNSSSDTAAEQNRRRQVLRFTQAQAAQQQRNQPTTGKNMEQAGKAMNAAGTGAQAAGAGMQAAGKTTQAAGAGVEAAGKGAQAVGKGMGSAAKALNATKYGAVIGAPLQALGAGTQAAGKGAEVAGKGVKAAGKGLDKTGKGVRQAGGRVKNAGRNTMRMGRDAQRRENLLASRSRNATRPPTIPSPINNAMGSKLPEIQSQRSGNDNEESKSEDVEQDNVEEEKETNINQLMQEARIQDLLADSMSVQAQEEQSQGDGAEDEAAKQLAKRILPRGAAFTGQGIADGITAGTGGAGIIGTIFIYAITLGYLNYEMFTGKLSWEPIPMPIDKDADLLKGLIVFADILVILTLVVLFAVQVIVILIMFSPLLIVTYFGSQGVTALLKLFT